MQQVGKVVEISNENIAKIEIKRKSSCSSDCSKCGGCAHPDQIMIVEAQNECGAAVGDNILLHSKSRGILSIAALVYIMPILLMFAGYFAVAGGEGIKIVASAVGLVIGALLCTAYSAKVKKAKTQFFTIELVNLQNR